MGGGEFPVTGEKQAVVGVSSHGRVGKETFLLHCPSCFVQMSSTGDPAPGYPVRPHHLLVQHMGRGCLRVCAGDAQAMSGFCYFYRMWERGTSLAVLKGPRGVSGDFQSTRQVHASILGSQE